LQASHDLVDIVFQSREDFARVAHLAAKMRDLKRHQSVLVFASLFFIDRLRISRADDVESTIDAFERTKGNVGKACCQNQRQEYRNGGEDHRVMQPGSELILQQDGRDSQTNTTERRPI
jgi:hypothetical protein